MLDRTPTREKFRVKLVHTALLDAQDDEHQVSFDAAGLGAFHVQTLMHKGYGDDQPSIAEEGLTSEKAQDAIALLLRPKEDLWAAATPQPEPASTDQELVV